MSEDYKHNPEEIKRAVKEALDDKRMDDIGLQLTNLATQMTKGFAEVHTRQDTANGKLNKHDKSIELIEMKNSNSVLYVNILWFLVTTLVGVVVFLITNQ
jgi:hypothetical protein